MKAAVRRVLMLSAMLSPQALYALGLGDIKLNSALNQPFDAEIELVAATPEANPRKPVPKPKNKSASRPNSARRAIATSKR